MEKADRKAAIAAYKERKVTAGIYTIHCEPSGETWVGKTPDVSKIANRIEFSLRQGMHPHSSLKAALQAHGAGAFRFRIVEELPDEENAYIRANALKDRQAHWVEALHAHAI
jgi:predicted GIY-YIG superfamily endonuclease